MVVGHYGKGFEGQYGWAASALGRTDSRFGFRQIEEAAQLEHLRPYYKLASAAVHSNVGAITFTPGLLEDERILLSGASDLGLVEPTHGVAISLYVLAASFLATSPSLHGMITAHALGHLVDTMGKELLAANRGIRERIRKSRSRSRRKRPTPMPVWEVSLTAPEGE